MAEPRGSRKRGKARHTTPETDCQPCSSDPGPIPLKQPSSSDTTPESGQPSTAGSRLTGSDAPLVLVAQDGAAQAELFFVNQTCTPLQSHDAPLLGFQLCGRDGRPLRTARVKGRLAPGECGNIRISLRFDPHTRAGNYSGSVLILDQAIPLCLVVPEQTIVELVPASLAVEAQPGMVLEHTISVTNQSNIPITVRSPRPVPLQPRDRTCSVLRQALRETRDDDYQEFLNNLVGAARESMLEDLGRFVVPTLCNTPLELLPAKQAVLTLRWTMPDPMSRSERFQAAMWIAGQRLLLEVYRPIIRARQPA